MSFSRFGLKDFIIILVDTNRRPEVVSSGVTSGADPAPTGPATVKTERETTLVQYYIYFLQWILVAIQEVLRIWGGGGKEECSYRKILSLFISVISWLYDDSVAQNYSNIENMNTSLSTNYRKNILASMKT